MLDAVRTPAHVSKLMTFFVIRSSSEQESNISDPTVTFGKIPGYLNLNVLVAKWNALENIQLSARKLPQLKGFAPLLETGNTPAIRISFGLYW